MTRNSKKLTCTRVEPTAACLTEMQLSNMLTTHSSRLSALKAFTDNFMNITSNKFSNIKPSNRINNTP